VSAWAGGPWPGRAAPAPDGATRFVVGYADEDPYSFADGTRMRFGRDDDACEIPVWEQINGRSLSRVAGELWCGDGQMWARNLSTAHELVVAGGGAARTLAARSAGEPGPACSLPAPRATVSAPSTGSWTLTVTAVAAAGRTEAWPGEVPAGGTVRVGDVPDRHRPAAEALCAPLLAGGPAPATYAEVAVALGRSERVARRRVEELCAHYRAQVEALPGGWRPDETLTQAVARILVTRNKLGARPRARR
jgi:hypothetical protein